MLTQEVQYASSKWSEATLISRSPRITAKAWNRVASVLPKLGSDQNSIYAAFAKAKEGKAGVH